MQSLSNCAANSLIECIRAAGVHCSCTVVIVYLLDAFICTRQTVESISRVDSRTSLKLDLDSQFGEVLMPDHGQAQGNGRGARPDGTSKHIQKLLYRAIKQLTSSLSYHILLALSLFLTE